MEAPPQEWLDRALDQLNEADISRLPKEARQDIEDAIIKIRTVTLSIDSGGRMSYQEIGDNVRSRRVDENGVPPPANNCAMMGIDKLEISPRAFAVLLKARFRTIDEIMLMKDEELQAVPGLGEAMFDEVRQAVERKMSDLAMLAGANGASRHKLERMRDKQREDQKFNSRF